MTTRLLSLTDISVIAHRGGAKLRPENTLAAFDHAVSLGVDACECDVHLSRDGEVVVIHDATLDRTTNAHGSVELYTAKDLAAMDAGYHFGGDAAFPCRDRGIGVPRLADVLDRHRDVPWVIEIKGERPETAEPVVHVLRDLDALDRVVIGGFSQRVLDAVRALAPGLPTGASSQEARTAARRAFFALPIKPRGYSAFQVPLRIRGREVFGEPFVRRARRASVPVHCWVIDDAADIRRLRDWGVTGFITDRPDIALKEVGQGQLVPRT